MNNSALAFALIGTLFAAVIPSPSEADPRVASIHVPDAELAGKARLKYLVWNVFDAELYAPAGRWKPDAPFALTLHYLRDFSGKAIARRSAEEIRKQGFRNEAKLAAWQRQMERIFPDVSEKTRITGVRDSNGHTIFYRNGRKIGAIRDREFTSRFFNIWLGRKVADPRFRNRLTGAG